jgi:hypothetical protein
MDYTVPFLSVFEIWSLQLRSCVLQDLVNLIVSDFVATFLLPHASPAEVVYCPYRSFNVPTLLSVGVQIHRCGHYTVLGRGEVKAKWGNNPIGSFTSSVRLSRLKLPTSSGSIWCLSTAYMLSSIQGIRSMWRTARRGDENDYFLRFAIPEFWVQPGIAEHWRYPFTLCSVKNFIAINYQGLISSHTNGMLTSGCTPKQDAPGPTLPAM